MVTITYRKSNDGEPAKVFSGMIDRLLFMIILRMKEKTEFKKNSKTFSLCTTEFVTERSNRVRHCYSCGMITHMHRYYLVDIFRSRLQI